MKALANIITNSKKIVFNLPINKCDNVECVDKTLPTLIIGYDLAKKYIENFNILEKTYHNQNIRWTFKKTEKAVEYEKDLKEFYEVVIMDYCDKFRYQYLNYVNLDRKSVIKIFRYLKSEGKKVIFNENNRFLYLLCPEYKVVYGFSLATSEFFGIGAKKIIKICTQAPNTEIITDFSEIPSEIKVIIGEKIDKYMVLKEIFNK